jgi:hypothetical protein
MAGILRVAARLFPFRFLPPHVKASLVFWDGFRNDGTSCSQKPDQLGNEIRRLSCVNSSA